jgi:hypothetical protein
MCLIFIKIEHFPSVKLCYKPPNHGIRNKSIWVFNFIEACETTIIAFSVLDTAQNFDTLAEEVDFE